MVLVGIVMAVALCSALVGSWSTQTAVTREMLERSLEGPIDSSPVMGRGEGADSGLIVTLEVNSSGVVIMRTGADVDTQTEDIDKVIEEALDSSQESGQSAENHIAWMKSTTATGFRISLCETTSRDEALMKQVSIDTVVFIASMAILYIVIRILSNWVLQPVEEAWNQQRRFVSDASHELKTPLAVICANTQILEREKGIPENAERWVKSTAEEASHMKGLVEDLLTLARADEAKAGTAAAVKREELNLSDLVEDCALEFDAVAFERGCSIETNVTPEIYIKADKDQIARVVRTLLDNATKYATGDAPVTMTLVRDHPTARIDVNNQSAPIDPEDLAHLFDRFYRTDKARSRQETGGYGLGLAIAKSIVEAHGGKIWATSDATHGTTFSFSL